jgi:hypothetical protein
LSLPVQMLARSLRVSLLDGRASKESPGAKPFRRIAPNVESDEASAPACWIRDIRTVQIRDQLDERCERHC